MPQTACPHQARTLIEKGIRPRVMKRGFLKSFFEDLTRWCHGNSPASQENVVPELGTLPCTASQIVIAPNDANNEQFNDNHCAMLPPQAIQTTPSIIYDSVTLKLPKVSVMFCDMNKFNQISQLADASEVAHWASFTFRVMNMAAVYYHIDNVQAIGDCFQAVCGTARLRRSSNPAANHPHAVSSFHEHTQDYGLTGNEGSTQRLLEYVCACEQIFSSQYCYVNGIKGICLQREEVPAAQQLAEVVEASPLQVEDVESYAETINVFQIQPRVMQTTHCGFRFGVAEGNANVCYDPTRRSKLEVTGEAPELARRLMTLGKPYRILCSDSVHQAIARSPAATSSLYVWDSPLAVDAGRNSQPQATTMTVTTYFLRGTYLELPQRLLRLLNLQPRGQLFMFS